MVGIGPDDAFEFERLKVLGGLVLDMQDDLGAPRHTLGLLVAGRRHLEAGAPRRSPDPGVRRTGPAARHVDAIGHHEGGVEAHAKLADETQALLGVLDPLQEGLRARARDRTEIVDQLLAIHPDARIGDRERLGRGVGLEANGELLIAGQQLRLGDRLVADLVQGVGRVRNQLPQEDIGLGVDRMDHQVQEFGDLRLKLMRLSAAPIAIHFLPSGSVNWAGVGYRTFGIEDKCLGSSNDQKLQRFPVDGTPVHFTLPRLSRQRVIAST